MERFNTGILKRIITRGDFQVRESPQQERDKPKNFCIWETEIGV